MLFVLFSDSKVGGQFLDFFALTCQDLIWKGLKSRYEIPMFIFHFHAAILSVIYGGMVKCNLIKKEIVVWSFFTSSFTLDHKVWNFFRTFKFSMKLYLPLVSILNSEGAKLFLWRGNFNLLMSIYIYSQNFVGCLKPFEPPLPSPILFFLYP